MTDLSPAGGDTPAANASTPASDAAAPSDSPASKPEPIAPAPGWTQMLDPELGALVAAKGWANPAEAVRSYRALERMLGADKVARPGQDAPAEAWDAFWSKLGRPAKPEGYGFARPAGFAEYDEATAAWARAAFHQAGLPQRMAADLHDSFLKHRAERGAALAAEARDGLDGADGTVGAGQP